MAKRLAGVAGITAIALVVWIALGYSDALRACAHDPRFVCSPRDTHPVDIPDVTKSWAYYGSLAANERDRFDFVLEKSTRNISWSLLVDVRDADDPARPTAILTGTKGQERLSFDHVTRFYEPFSRETYLQTGERMLNLEAGHYRILVTMPTAARRQRYVMAIGNAERFSPLELPFVLGALDRIRRLQY